MILTIIFVITFCIVWASIYIIEHKKFNGSYKEANKLVKYIRLHKNNILSLLYMMFTVLVLFGLMMACITIGIYGDRDTKLTLNEQRYETFKYKIYYDMQTNENGLISKELIDDISEWNNEVIKSRQKAQSKWTGIFNPDSYEGLETIDYYQYIEIEGDS